MIVKLILIYISVFCVNVQSARILAVYPVPAKSHHVVFRVFTNELINRGHEVVVITTDPEFNDKNRPANLTEIDVHDVSYATWKTEYVDKVNTVQSLVSKIKIAFQVVKTVLEVQIQTPQMKEFLDKEQNFDLVVVEDAVPLSLGFAHKYKAPVIRFSSFYIGNNQYMQMGAPIHPFLYPPYARQKVTDFTLKDKLISIAGDIVLKYIYSQYIQELNKSLKVLFGEDSPSIEELQFNVDMIFVNSNPMWDVSRPIPMSIQFLGGLHIKQAKELPKDLKTYLDSSKNGVIYVSFGTNLNPSQFSKHAIEAFLGAFSQLPYDIMWKWDKDDLEGKPKNVRLFKWAPQIDILRHPKVKLFITQGGLQSTDEAIAAGVPVIGIPMLLDQYFNAAKYVQHNIGIKLTMDTLTEEQLMHAIKKIIEDKSYKNNITHLRTLIYDQPQSPLEKAVWWAEYVIRHKGAKHLHGPAGKVGWVEYLELQLLATIIAILTGVLILFVAILYGLLKLIIRFYMSLFLIYLTKPLLQKTETQKKKDY